MVRTPYTLGNLLVTFAMQTTLSLYLSLALFIRLSQLTGDQCSGEASSNLSTTLFFARTPYPDQLVQHCNTPPINNLKSLWSNNGTSSSDGATVFYPVKMAILRAEEASSSSSASGHRYQVFLSFRGKDTRKTFTDHLYMALVHAGIHTFTDKHELKRGENITYELHKAIGESKIAVIVFSKGYASSEWCLDELVGILERKKTKGIAVIPIFYNVQPSDVRYQKGSFSEAFSIHQGFEFKSEELMNKMEKWRVVLRESQEMAIVVGVLVKIFITSAVVVATSKGG
ncbi:hypothetical protein LguiA_005624 [Lonicera macranthoides]